VSPTSIKTASLNGMAALANVWLTWLPWKLAVVGAISGAAMWFLPGAYLNTAEDGGMCRGSGQNIDMYRDVQSRAFDAGFTENAQAKFTVNVMTQRITCSMSLDGRQENFHAGPTRLSRVGLALFGTSFVLLTGRTIQRVRNLRRTLPTV